MAFMFKSLDTGAFAFGGCVRLRGSTTFAGLDGTSCPWSLVFPFLSPPPFGSHFTLLSRIHTLFLHLLAWASATEVAGTTTHRRQIPAAPESTPPRQACHEIMSAPCQADNSRLPPTITIRVELPPESGGERTFPSARGIWHACPISGLYP